MQMAPRGNVRGNTATIPLKFHVWIVASSFFLLELSRTKLCKFPTRRFPRWPDYKKKKENHPLFLIHVTRVIFIKEKNFIYRSKGGEMIRDYLLLLSWLCAVQGKIGKYPDGDACVSAPILNFFSFSRTRRTRYFSCSSLRNSSSNHLKKFVARWFFERYVREEKRKITYPTELTSWRDVRVRSCPNKNFVTELIRLSFD